jgi:cell division ATPase FtsA
MSATNYTIGLDYGTNSVRTLIVNVANGREVASAVWNYEHGTQGVILSRDPNLARQHPADYVEGTEITIKQALALARRSVRGFKPAQIIGGHHGQHAVAGGPQWPPARARPPVRQEPCGDGLALERPHRRR